MNKYKLTHGLLALALLAVPMISCTDSVMDDINVDKNHAQDVQAKFIVTDLITSTAFSTVGGDFSTYASVYIEQEAGIHNQLFNAETRNGEPSSTNTYNNVWSSTYTNLKNAKTVIAKCSGEGKYYQNYYTTPSFGGGFYSGTPLMYPIDSQNAFTEYGIVYDPNLKPQNTRSYELGADISFFNNLVSINYTYSRQNVKDQIFEVPLASSTGSSSFMTNGGKIHTNAHELTVNINPIRLKNVDWNIGINWSKIDNYVDELAPGVESIFLGGFTTPQVRAGIGDKFPVIYGVSYARDDNGNLIVDEDGVPMAGKDDVIGKVSPDFILGFNTNLRLWKFNISAVFDWKQGGQIYCGTNGLLDMYGVSKNTENREGSFIVEGVKEDGSKNTTPISGANEMQHYYETINNINESSVYNSSFIKLRELAVSYPVFQKKWLEVNLNVFARNILVWSELANIDPESTQGNTNMAGSFERFSLPTTSSYGFGLNVKF